MSEESLLFELPPQDLRVADKKFRERNPIWTGCKARLIERYLFLFVQITKSGTYFDAFAGPQEVDKPEMWSAKLVIESYPRWFKKFLLFEKKQSQVALIHQMIETQPPRNKKKREPKRTIEVFPGDFNEQIKVALGSNPIKPNEATFCLLDQRTFECDWESVKSIALHKQGGNKIELFYFFPEGWLNRSVAALKLDKQAKMEKWWGNSQWPELLKRQGYPYC